MAKKESNVVEVVGGDIAKQKSELDAKFRKMSKQASKDWAKQMGGPRTPKKTVKKGKK